MAGVKWAITVLISGYSAANIGMTKWTTRIALFVPTSMMCPSGGASAYLDDQANCAM